MENQDTVIDSERALWTSDIAAGLRMRAPPWLLDWFRPGDGRLLGPAISVAAAELVAGGTLPAAFAGVAR